MDGPVQGQELQEHLPLGGVGPPGAFLQTQAEGPGHAQGVQEHLPLGEVASPGVFLQTLAEGPGHAQEQAQGQAGCQTAQQVGVPLQKQVVLSGPSNVMAMKGGGRGVKHVSRAYIHTQNAHWGPSS